MHSDTVSYFDFAPKAIESNFGQITREQTLEVPQSWVDASAYLHIEGSGSAYTLFVNGRKVVQCDDSFTPTDYNISPYLYVGQNTISVISHASALPQLEQGVEKPQRAPFEGSYIFAQRRLRILDYSLNLIEHEDKLGGQLFIDVIVENDFNYEESIEVGFDVYGPDGKLIDFSTSKATLEGGTTDTIRFAPHLYGAAKTAWNPARSTTVNRTKRYTDQSLYSVMLFVKNNRVSSDYIPFKVGYFLPQFKDGNILVDGSPIDIKSIKYNALGSSEECEKQLRALKQQGYNTIAPSTPQPLFFYELCDKLGLYVNEQVAINAPAQAENMARGGTPSNDPTLKDEYIARGQKMYYRTRNFTCIIAYALGDNSGNGYNMYKLYEWLKSVETKRPVIYNGAAGQWNSDVLKVN